MLNSSYKISVRTKKTVSQAPTTCDYTSLLLNMNGANNSTVFTDLSTYNHTITVNGNAKISTVQSKFGGGSAFFDGTGDFLQIANNTNFDFPADFTIECFINYSNTKLMALYTRRVNSVGTAPIVTIDMSAGNIGVNLYGSSGNTAFATTGLSLNNNTWHHVAVCRSGSTSRLFINGILRASSSTNVGAMNWSNSVITIGRDSFYTARDYNGYIDEFRVLKGLALYTSNFTPPTAPFDSCRTGILNGSRANTLGFSGNGTATSKKSLGGRILCYPDITFTALQSGTLRLTADLVESNCTTEDEFYFSISNPLTTSYTPCSNVTDLNLSYSITAGQTITIGYQYGDPYITDPKLWIE